MTPFRVVFDYEELLLILVALDKESYKAMDFEANTLCQKYFDLKQKIINIIK